MGVYDDKPWVGLYGEGVPAHIEPEAELLQGVAHPTRRRMLLMEHDQNRLGTNHDVVVSCRPAGSR